MKAVHGLPLAVLTVVVWHGAAAAASGPTCADYPNQAAAQRAADTRDGDGDGIYCEDLPCPCSGEAGGGSGGQTPPNAPASCSRPKGVKRIVFSKRRYPNIRRHVRAAVRHGWPRRLVLTRRGADERRARLLAGVAARDGYDRDEYPPAVGRGKGKGLSRGRHPRGWKADVAYVPSSENRSHGARLGAKLRGLCNGTRFRYVFR